MDPDNTVKNSLNRKRVITPNFSWKVLKWSFWNTDRNKTNRRNNFQKLYKKIKVWYTLCKLKLGIVVLKICVQCNFCLPRLPTDYSEDLKFLSILTILNQRFEYFTTSVWRYIVFVIFWGIWLNHHQIECGVTAVRLD